MSNEKYRKRLSANDVGATGGHQGGVCIPKGAMELLALLPALDPKVKNPDAWLKCVDDTGRKLKLRFVYYNNRLHDPSGTRNEYRITHMTTWLRDVGAKVGDEFEISRADVDNQYAIGIRQQDAKGVDPDQGIRIRLTGWRRIH